MTLTPGDPLSQTTAPFYLPTANEAEVFQTAVEAHLPVMLVGPTGCGKTRFVE